MSALSGVRTVTKKKSQAGIKVVCSDSKKQCCLSILKFRCVIEKLQLWMTMLSRTTESATCSLCVWVLGKCWTNVTVVWCLIRTTEVCRQANSVVGIAMPRRTTESARCWLYSEGVCVMSKCNSSVRRQANSVWNLKVEPFLEVLVVWR